MTGIAIDPYAQTFGHDYNQQSTLHKNGVSNSPERFIDVIQESRGPKETADFPALEFAIRFDSIHLSPNGLISDIVCSIYILHLFDNC